jgi:hypothetical protein
LSNLRDIYGLLASEKGLEVFHKNLFYILLLSVIIPIRVSNDLNFILSSTLTSFLVEKLSILITLCRGEAVVKEEKKR